MMTREEIKELYYAVRRREYWKLQMSIICCAYNGNKVPAPLLYHAQKLVENTRMNGASDWVNGMLLTHDLIIEERQRQCN